MSRRSVNNYFIETFPTNSEPVLKCHPPNPIAADGLNINRYCFFF